MVKETRRTRTRRATPLAAGLSARPPLDGLLWAWWGCTSRRANSTNHCTGPRKGARGLTSSSGPHLSAMVAGRYEQLGLTEDADYWVADAVANTPQPEQRFLVQVLAVSNTWRPGRNISRDQQASYSTRHRYRRVAGFLRSPVCIREYFCRKL